MPETRELPPRDYGYAGQHSDVSKADIPYIRARINLAANPYTLGMLLDELEQTRTLLAERDAQGVGSDAERRVADAAQEAMERVRALLPDAHMADGLIYGKRMIFRIHDSAIYGMGDTAEEAWLNAESKLPKTSAGWKDADSDAVRVVRPVGGSVLVSENAELVPLAVTDDRNRDPLYVCWKEEFLEPSATPAPPADASRELRKALVLIEHKADQALQGQYTHEQLLGVILHTARAALAHPEAGPR